ncbi:MAG: DUF5596 domain-containing protein [Clostridia bacterium]|nr:DUF5596 domain-containing protein [Clostridia bacterium]
MHDYLRAYFDEFEYSAADRLALSLAYERIRECSGAYERLAALLLGYERDTLFIDAEKEKEVDAIARAACVHPYTARLLTFILLFRTMRERLSKLGLSKKIIFLTLSDLIWKLNECKMIHGVVGVEQFEWYTRFTSLRIFAIGRLQFELKNYTYTEGAVTVSGGTVKSGDPILSVHIPRTGTPLEPKLCNAAYREARKLFTKLLGIPDIPFMCTSWLLYPKNREILPPDSNIVRFMDRYEIIDVVNHRKDKNSSIPFVFGVKMTTPVEQLPERSTLHRGYKAHLLEGGRMGVGVGIFFLEA